MLVVSGVRDIALGKLQRTCAGTDINVKGAPSCGEVPDGRHWPNQVRLCFSAVCKWS